MIITFHKSASYLNYLYQLHSLCQNWNGLHRMQRKLQTKYQGFYPLVLITYVKGLNRNLPLLLVLKYEKIKIFLCLQFNVDIYFPFFNCIRYKLPYIDQYSMQFLIIINLYAVFIIWFYFMSVFEIIYNCNNKKKNN